MHRTAKTRHACADEYDAALRKVCARGWTAKQVGEFMGVSDATISYRRNGKRQISLESLYALYLLLSRVGSPEDTTVGSELAAVDALLTDALLKIERAEAIYATLGVHSPRPPDAPRSILIEDARTTTRRAHWMVRDLANRDRPTGDRPE